MSDGNISFHSEDISFTLSNKKLLRGWISKVVQQKGHPLGPISFIFCSDNYLHQLNVQYLNHDTLTDIITFDYTEEKEISGDLFISYERVKENAKDLGIPLKKELHRVMIHGVLHLLGYQDKSKKAKEEMTKQENLALEILEKELL